MTQSTDPSTIVPGASIACFNGLATAETSIARSFTMASDYTVGCVTFGIESSSPGDWSVEVRLLSGLVTGPYGALVLLDSAIVGVPGGTTNTLLTAKFPSGVLVGAGQSLVVELRVPSRAFADGGDGGSTFLGANSSGQTAPSYVRATWCGAADFIPSALIGSPDLHVVMTLIGPPAPTACELLTPLCCAIVCAIDAFCCESFWDLSCQGLAASLCTCSNPSVEEEFVLRSGQSGGVPGTAGQLDDSATYATGGPTNACFSGSLAAGGSLPFVAASFGGLKATVVTAHPQWLTSLPADPSARWINWSIGAGNQGRPPHSTLYAHHFQINGNVSGLAAIKLTWAVDDGLGDPTGGPAPVGAYINGVPIPTLSGGSLNAQTSITALIPAGTLTNGQNTLHLYQRDLGCVVSGLIYSATILACVEPLTFDPCCPDPVGSVMLRSGQVGGLPGLPGNDDDTINCTTAGSPGSCFNGSLDMGSGLPFAAACAGAPAKLVTPVPPLLSTLPCDPLARWINVYANGPSNLGTPGHSTLYCHPFTAAAEFSTACITFCWSVDDYLGDPLGGPAPVGVYIENAFGAITPLPALTGGAGGAQLGPIAVSIPAGAITPNAVNRMFVYQRDGGCAISGVIYSAQIDFCGGCTSPPPGMTGWWSFDELSGTVADDLTPNANNGAHQPAVGGPAPTPGQVAGALTFDGLDDAVVVPPTLFLETSCGGLTVDLWVKRPVPMPGEGRMNLVSRYDSSGGWLFALEPSTGQLVLVLEGLDGSGFGLRCLHESIATVPVNTWTHVAFTLSPCCGPLDRGLIFFVDGVPEPSVLVDCCDLTSLSGPASIAMGAPVWINGPFRGTMDEVEIFCRAVEPHEIAAIHAAGIDGKCKETCKASWDRTACINIPAQFNTPADGTIHNNSGVSRTYLVTIAEKPGCAVTGITYTPASATITVGPNSVGSVSFTPNASGASGVGQACFEVTFTNLATGEACSAMGSLFVKQCDYWVNPTEPNVIVAADGVGTAQFAITAGPNGAAIAVQAVALPSDMISTESPVSLNDLPPGKPVVATFDLAPNAVAILDLDIFFPFCGFDLDWFDIVLFVGPDDGTPLEPVSSIGLRQADVIACPGDLNGDGVVDGADLGIMLLNWGASGAGDLNGDGVVTGADLGLLLLQWGSCV